VWSTRSPFGPRLAIDLVYAVRKVQANQKVLKFDAS